MCKHCRTWNCHNQSRLDWLGICYCRLNSDVWRGTRCWSYVCEGYPTFLLIMLKDIMMAKYIIRHSTKTHLLLIIYRSYLTPCIRWKQDTNCYYLIGTVWVNIIAIGQLLVLHGDTNFMNYQFRIKCPVFHVIIWTFQILVVLESLFVRYFDFLKKVVAIRSKYKHSDQEFYFKVQIL